MKKSLLLIPALLVVLAAQGFAQCTLSVKWSFKGVEEGYDHKNKCVVFVDGEEVGQSTVTVETVPNSMKVTIPSGEHTVRVINYALYEGQWEAHTIENNYSQDCLAEKTANFGKKSKLAMVFDIDNGVSVKWK